MNTVDKREIVYINYFDGIDMDRARALMGLCTQIIGKYNPEKIYFTFSSPGGQVNAGITLYNFLKAIPPKIIMHNIGSVDSIGTVVFLAGDERYASPNTTFLFHGVETGFNKDVGLSLNKIDEIRSALNEDQNKIAGIVASNTKITEEEIRKLFSNGESKSLDFVLSKGFISQVKEVNIPKGEVIVNVAFNINR